MQYNSLFYSQSLSDWMMLIGALAIIASCLLYFSVVIFASRHAAGLNVMSGTIAAAGILNVMQGAAGYVYALPEAWAHWLYALAHVPVIFWLFWSMAQLIKHLPPTRTARLA